MHPEEITDKSEDKFNVHLRSLYVSLPMFFFVSDELNGYLDRQKSATPQRKVQIKLIFIRIKLIFI